MSNGQRLKIFLLKSEISQSFPYYHYYHYYFCGRYKMMHLDKRKILEVFKQKKKVYSLPFTHSGLFAVPCKQISLLEILLLLFPLPGTMFPRAIEMACSLPLRIHSNVTLSVRSSPITHYIIMNYSPLILLYFSIKFITTYCTEYTYACIHTSHFLSSVY